MSQEAAALARSRELLARLAKNESDDDGADEIKSLARQAHASLKQARDLEEDVQLKAILAMLADHHRDMKRRDFVQLACRVEPRRPTAANNNCVELNHLLPALAHSRPPTSRPAPRGEMAVMRTSSAVAASEPWTEIKTIKRASMAEANVELQRFQLRADGDKAKLRAAFNALKEDFSAEQLVCAGEHKRVVALRAELVLEERERAKREDSLRQVKRDLTNILSG